MKKSVRKPVFDSSVRTKKNRKKKSTRFKKWAWGIIVLGLLLAVLLASTAYYGVRYYALPMQSDMLDVQIEAGASPKKIANQLHQAGVQVPSFFIYEFFKWSGKSSQLKAGSYEIKQGTSALELLNQLVEGKQAMRTVVLVEGWNFQQFRQALAKAPDLVQDTAAWSEQDFMKNLGLPNAHPEGQFFPDTYHYAKNTSDVLIWQQAFKQMQIELDLAWSKRRPDLTLQSPYEALILASIVEKETGLASDRTQIAGVFHNRLRIGMRLQTDPSVIYGVPQFDGNLRKIDLQTDSPYNTYTRSGLPPTPIAMPGRASLLAATYPMPTEALYFVAKGDGSSYFSVTLDQHNNAVNEYIRKKN